MKFTYCLVVFCSIHLFANQVDSMSIVSMADTTVKSKEVQDFVDVQGNLSLQVANVDDITEKILVYINTLDGYYTERNDKYLSIKVPTKHFYTCLQKIGALGIEVDKNFNSRSLNHELLLERNKLISNRALLKDYFQILAESQANTFIAVEEEIQELLQSIELSESTIRQMEASAQYASLQINFQFQERQAPTTNGNTAFSWVNGINLNNLLEDFQ